MRDRISLRRADPPTWPVRPDARSRWGVRGIAGAVDDAFAAAERVRGRDAALARRLERANGRLANVLGAVESGDGAPTEVERTAFRAQRRARDGLLREARR